MRILTWNDFEVCVAEITKACTKSRLCGVYGFPRGGLCLAVALSHSLHIPLLEEPRANSLVVDDIYETGFTLNKIIELNDITAFVWISKVTPDWWNAVETTELDEWVVFPWESKSFAEADQIIYKSSRGL